MRWYKTVGLVAAAAICAFGVACGGERATAASKAETPPPPGLIEALEGHQTGDLIPTNNAAFQLQLSRFPWRFVVRMQAPREAVAPGVDAYFRNLGVEDMASSTLTWCESLKRGAQECGPATGRRTSDGANRLGTGEPGVSDAGADGVHRDAGLGRWALTVS